MCIALRLLSLMLILFCKCIISFITSKSSWRSTMRPGQRCCYTKSEHLCILLKMQEFDSGIRFSFTFNRMLMNFFRLTRDCPRFKDELDLLKFVCKEFWMVLYKKQIDNLRTNHQVLFGCRTVRSSYF